MISTMGLSSFISVKLFISYIYPMFKYPLIPLILTTFQFDKYSAMATYGVLPAANIPPPYALASISAVQFDYYGQRFATAALDGTVCTWQVEAGGRSNVHPTESSICFDSHASYVYQTPSMQCNSQ
jgi:WD40 repeat protein